MAGWHHLYNEHELGQTSGDGEGQGGLVCCSPWGYKKSEMTGQLNNSIPIPNVRDFPGGPVVKNLPSNVGDAGLIPGPGTKSPHA